MLIVTWIAISLLGLAYAGVKLRMREVPIGPAQDDAIPSPAPPDPRILARMELYTTLARRPPPPARFSRRGIVMDEDAVEWINGSRAEGVERGRCPVCADPLGTQAICACRSCESAHHIECWQYAGGCARYACGSDVARVN
jgi:hypothetical protein